MRVHAIVLLFLFYYAECRKTYVPLDKNANTAFINFESGGVHPGNAPSKNPTTAQGKPVSAPQPVVTPSHNAAQTPINSPPKQPQPVQPPTQPKPAHPAQPPTQPIPAHPAQNPTQSKPTHPTYSPLPPKPQTPNQIKPVPVNPAPVAHPASTPGPGSVKQLINYYDSQGKGSPIRPYSYSQAVKQG